MDAVITFLMNSPALLWVIKSTLIVLTGCFVVACMKKGTPSVRYGVWLAVFLALAVLPVVHWLLPGWKLTVPVKEVVVSAPELPDHTWVPVGSSPQTGRIQLAWAGELPTGTQV